jgi:hypothetical protein
VTATMFVLAMLFAWQPHSQEGVAFTVSLLNAEIEYVSTRGGAPDRYRQRGLTGAPRAIDGVSGIAGHGRFRPEISPDGRLICYTADVDGRQLDIFVVSTDGRGDARMTSHPADEYGCSWTRSVLDPPALCN